MTNLTKKDWKLIEKYSDLLVYNTYRISFTGELEEYNVLIILTLYYGLAEQSNSLKPIKMLKS